MGKNLVKPNREYVNKVLNSKGRKEYFIADKALQFIFLEFPKNNKYYQILTKASILNQLYRTNILDIYTVAWHIYRLRSVLDNKLSIGASDIVERIASVRFGARKRYFYSFATKYCSWHCPEKYFIFDSFVEKILWEYKKKFGFADYKRGDMWNYKKFHMICLKFKSYFGLNYLPNKKLDEFLWLESKRLYK